MMSSADMLLAYLRGLKPSIQQQVMLLLPPHCLMPCMPPTPPTPRTGFHTSGINLRLRRTNVEVMVSRMVLYRWNSVRCKCLKPRRDDARGRRSRSGNLRVNAMLVGSMATLPRIALTVLTRDSHQKTSEACRDCIRVS